MVNADAKTGRIKRWNDVYNRFFEHVGNILMDHSVGTQFRVSPLPVTVMFSLLVAFGSALIELNDHSVKYYLGPLSALWSSIVVVAIWRWGVRGIWTLLGLPLAMYKPAIVALRYISCYWLHDCL